MNIFEFHYIGGVIYMIPLTILFLAIATLTIMSFLRKEAQGSKWIDAIKHLGKFTFAWGAFGTLVGLYEAFSDLSQMEQMIPLQHIMGGLKVALITVLYGFGIFLFTQLALLGLRLRADK